MKYFNQLSGFPEFNNIIPDLKTLIDSGQCSWKSGQICLNSTVSDPDNFHLGTGSLIRNWDVAQETSADGIVNVTSVPRINNNLREEDFTVLCSVFKNTELEQVYNFLNNKYVLGRVRLIKSEPKTCMSWHTDTSPRIHYVIDTEVGCHMVIADEVLHLERNTWWWTETTEPHTAFNASFKSRIHLVVVVLGER